MVLFSDVETYVFLMYLIQDVVEACFIQPLYQQVWSPMKFDGFSWEHALELALFPHLPLLGGPVGPHSQLVDVVSSVRNLRRHCHRLWRRGHLFIRDLEIWLDRGQ